jgi:phage/plasmid-associated DNA primase
MMFLANLVQNPGRKAMWGILIQSTQGSGKGLLAEIIESILGQNNCLTNVTFDGLVRDHSTLLKGKQFIVINELMLTGRRVEGKELANKLKPFFTDPVHIINPKFKEEILCPNLVNLFLYSNDPKPLHVDQDDRRLCAIKDY